MQLQRYLETIWLLIQRRSITAQELAEHFEVSVRTIYRDLDVLSAAGIPLYTEKGRGGGIRLMDDHVLNRTYLTDDEQKEILAALHSFNQVYDPATSSVLNKFSALFPHLDVDWIHVDFTNWAVDTSNELFNLFKNAILNCQCLHFSYISNEGQESERTVDPYKLIFKGSAWYIYAYCHLRQGFRFFKISRIINLTVLEETFNRKPITKLPSMQAWVFGSLMNLIRMLIPVMKTAISSLPEPFLMKAGSSDLYYLSEMPVNYLNLVCCGMRSAVN